MTIMQIRYFLEVCKRSSITRAAEQLHVSQPSISNSIRELETELGVNLFHRIKKRLSLTQEGLYFSQKAGQIIMNLDLLTEEMLDIGSKRNKIKVGVPPMIGTFLFPDIFEVFQKLNPNIRLEMIEHGSLRLHELIQQEVLDIAFAIMEPGSENLNSLNIKKTTLQYCINRNHALAGKKSVNFEDLADEPVILFQSGSYQNELILSRFHESGVDPNIILYSNQLYTMKQMIAKGKCGTFLFQEIQEMDQELTGIPLAEPIELDIALIWKKERHMYSDTAKLIEVVKQLFAPV